MSQVASVTSYSSERFLIVVIDTILTADEFRTVMNENLKVKPYRNYLLKICDSYM